MHDLVVRLEVLGHGVNSVEQTLLCVFEHFDLLPLSDNLIVLLFGLRLHLLKGFLQNCFIFVKLPLLLGFLLQLFDSID